MLTIALRVFFVEKWITKSKTESITEIFTEFNAHSSGTNASELRVDRCDLQKDRQPDVDILRHNLIRAGEEPCNPVFEEKKTRNSDPIYSIVCDFQCVSQQKIALWRTAVNDQFAKWALNCLSSKSGNVAAQSARILQELRQFKAKETRVGFWVERCSLMIAIDSYEKCGWKSSVLVTIPSHRT